MELFYTSRITRIDAEYTQKIQDDHINELHTTLVLDGESDTQLVMTPEHPTLWALGNLFSRKLIQSRLDVKEIKVEWTSAHCLIWVTRSSSSFASASESAALWQTTPEAIRKGIHWLSEAPLYQKTGAAHVAALLTPQGEKLFRVEDIGRHNTIDKVLGWGLEQNIDFSTTMLVTSGRLAEDMVLKGAAAGLPLIASVSAATAQGIERARENGVTLAGFVREKRMNVYTYPERIIQTGA